MHKGPAVEGREDRSVHKSFIRCRLNSTCVFQSWKLLRLALFDISILNIDCRYINTFENIDIDINVDMVIFENIDIDKAILENIDIDIDIDKAILKNIDIDIDRKSLRNIDIDKGIIKISIW